MPKTHAEKTVEIDHELTEKQPNSVVKSLKVLLADESVLYTRLRNYHWNVTGVDFYALHAAFEDQLDDIAVVIDDIAERIRQLGVHAPGTMDEFIRKARLEEDPRVYPDARTMVANLVADHESVVLFLRNDIKQMTHESGDVGVIDLLTTILQQHQKMAWMLWMYLES